MGGLWNGPEERNQGCLDLWRDWLNTGRRLTATGATDAHRPEDWEGEVPLTCVEAADSSLASVLNALRAGRTYVSSGPRLEIRAVAAGGRVTCVGETASRAGTEMIAATCDEAPDAELRLVGNAGAFAAARVETDGSVEASRREGDT